MRAAGARGWRASRTKSVIVLKSMNGPKSGALFFRGRPGAAAGGQRHASHHPRRRGIAVGRRDRRHRGLASAVGMSGSPCRAPSVASVEALFASCTGPIPPPRTDLGQGSAGAAPFTGPNAPAVAGSGTDVEATGDESATTRRTVSRYAAGNGATPGRGAGPSPALRPAGGTTRG